jgi:AraC-like DNA-binding protein
MHASFSSETYGTLYPQYKVPIILADYVIPDSHATSLEGEFGCILFQEIPAGQFMLRYTIYKIQKDLALNFEMPYPVLQTHVALKNNVQYNLKDMGYVSLKEGQYNIFHLPNAAGTSYLERGNEYRTFETNYTPVLLYELEPFFPPLREFLHTANMDTPGRLMSNHGWMNRQTTDIIEAMLTCPYRDDLRTFYYDLKIREFLLLLLNQYYHNNIPAHLTRRHVDAIYESRHIIDTAFGGHLTLSAISRQVSMNEFKLKNGFRDVFGIGMFEYLLKLRMLQARKLLLETDKPIKEIAMLTGYSTKQSFLTAFKKYYSETPGSIRRT